MLAPFFAHSSFRTLLLTQLRGFVRSTTRSALPFHVAQPRIVFKAHRKLSSALFSHLQAAQTWSLGELSCTCTDLAKRHPSLPKHEGHLLFSGSDTHELFDPDIVRMLSGSMRNSFFPPRGVFWPVIKDMLFMLFFVCFFLDRKPCFCACAFFVKTICFSEVFFCRKSWGGRGALMFGQSGGSESCFCYVSW